MDVMVSGLSLLHEPDEIIEIEALIPSLSSAVFRADSSAIARALGIEPCLLPDNEPCEKRAMRRNSMSVW